MAKFVDIVADSVPESDIRDLHNLVVNELPAHSPLCEFLAHISEGLKYGHNMTLVVKDHGH